MQYYIITNAVLILFFLSFIFLLFKWLGRNINNKEILTLFIFSIGLTLLFKFPFSYHFLGLEYEDSYIFNFSARQLADGIYPISFLTDGINVGSLKYPVSTVTYGGHFITYPVFISWAYSIFGYYIYLPSYLNSFISFLIILSLSISFKQLFGFKNYWFIPGIIFCLSPAMNVFGNTHLSETFSSFIVLITILSFYYHFQSNTKISIFIFAICLFTVLLTKRENMVLYSLFIIYSFYMAFADDKKRMTNYLPLITSVLVLFIYLFFIQNVFLIEKTESTEISAQTFRVFNFLNSVPIYIAAITTLKWFNIYLLVFIISAIFITFYWKKYPFPMALVVLYFSFFIVYTFHYRSYYFVHFGSIVPFEALRYLNNFFVISCLIISFSLCELLNFAYFRKPLITIFSIVIAVSLINTYLLRMEFSNMERENRFLNPKLVLEYLNQKERSILITDNIIVFQLLGDRDLELVDINALSDFPEKYRNRDKYIFLTNFNRENKFEYRYPEVFNRFQLLNKNEVLKFGNDDTLFKID